MNVAQFHQNLLMHTTGQPHDENLTIKFNTLTNWLHYCGASYSNLARAARFTKHATLPPT